jgi:hypothetical protein
MNIQEYVNTSYPPTNTFDVETLEPTSLLKQRWEIMSREFPEFWCGTNLLDVGCNNGWFSLFNYQSFDYICAVDPYEAIEVGKKLNIGIGWIRCTFGKFESILKYDRVLILNGPHHLYNEAGGWTCIDKLATLSSEYVLTEGAKDRSCPDFKDYNPLFDLFENRMEEYFTKVKQVPSISYTPGRYITLWEKKDNG